MPKQRTGRAGKKAANTPYKKGKAGKGGKGGNKRDSLFTRKPRQFGIGQALPPSRDLRHFVRWPRYVQLQRHKRVLWDRLSVPPSINQFTRTLDKNQATALFTLLDKYKPETRKEKQQRLLAKAKGEGGDEKKPAVLKFGLKHVTALVEAKKANLVVIAHDVDPIEIVVWLPALCQRKEVPYVIVKGKSRLGQLVHQKTATAVALTDVRKEDTKAFENLIEIATSQYNDRYNDLRKEWGGGKLGIKARAVERRRNKALRKAMES